MSTPEERQWQLLQRQLDRIEDKQDRMLTRTEFAEFKKENNEKIDQIEEDVQEIRQAAISPEQVTTMVGEGLKQSQARGLTNRDRYIRYGLAALSLATFILLVLDRVRPHG